MLFHLHVPSLPASSEEGLPSIQSRPSNLHSPFPCRLIELTDVLIWNGSEAEVILGTRKINDCVIAVGNNLRIEPQLGEIDGGRAEIVILEAEVVVENSEH